MYMEEGGGGRTLEVDIFAACSFSITKHSRNGKHPNRVQFKEDQMWCAKTHIHGSLIRETLLRS